MKKETTMKNEFKITLQQRGTDAVTWLALLATDVVEAMKTARACMGADWFIVTVEG